VEAIDSEGTVSIILDTENNELRVEDDGSGISVEHQERLFTPFFSTKNSGQGIGLTISREIAMNHGFNTSLKNRSEKGAVFTIIFNTSFI
nr:sensor histidine kinase [Bacteroidota bacterium]